MGVTVWTSPNGGSLQLIGTYTPANDPKGYTGWDFGKFWLGQAAVTIPNVVAGEVTLELQIWDYDDPNATGTFQTFDDAVAGNDYVGIVVFTNPVSEGVVLPPEVPSLTGMPSVILAQPTPEPATLALAGLGIASLLAFRRRS